MMSCNQCHSPNLIEGRLNENGEIVFLIQKERKPVPKTAIAYTCAECGHIHLSFDPDSVKICYCKEVST